MGRIEEAMRETPRRDFLPSGQRSNADRDRALSIGYGSTCSQPSTVLAMLQMLDAQPGDRVLDVGSGSGWTTAILSRLVGADGSVRGLEIVAPLVELATDRLAAAGIVNATVHRADPAVPGDPAHAPYDRVLVSAETDIWPQPLIDQLVDGGRLLLPLQGRLVAITRHGDDTEVQRSAEHYRFVPLVIDQG